MWLVLLSCNIFLKGRFVFFSCRRVYQPEQGSLVVTTNEDKEQSERKPFVSPGASAIFSNLKAAPFGHTYYRWFTRAVLLIQTLKKAPPSSVTKIKLISTLSLFSCPTILLLVCLVQALAVTMPYTQGISMWSVFKLWRRFSTFFTQQWTMVILLSQQSHLNFVKSLNSGNLHLSTDPELLKLNFLFAKIW